MRSVIVALGVGMIAVGVGSAAEPVAVPATDVAALEAVVRPMILNGLPEPLLHTERDWGRQVNAVVGLTWRRGKPTPRHAVRNDGHWNQLTVTALNPAETFEFHLVNVVSPEPGRTTFEVLLAMDVRAEHEFQEWKNGVRLLGTTTKVRCRAGLKLHCDLRTRLEVPPGGFVPVATMQIQVTAAQVGYDEFVCEQVGKLHGKAAKVTGDAVKRFVTKTRPDIERRMLERANAAVVQAAGKTEVRVELDKLLAGRSPVTTKK